MVSRRFLTAIFQRISAAANTRSASTRSSCKPSAYAEGNNIGAGAIRDFYGALSLKKAHKGIFVTTSAFSQPAVETARGLGSRIVLIDGLQLSRLMIRYNVGCRDEDVLHLKKVDEDFFEG